MRMFLLVVCAAGECACNVGELVQLSALYITLREFYFNHREVYEYILLNTKKLLKVKLSIYLLS